MLSDITSMSDIKISVDKLDVLADYTTFARFDRFNSKVSECLGRRPPRDNLFPMTSNA